ncbi:hypothetical protein JCM10213_009028 [Rhodosporidiobolus nylandii]
MLAVAELKRLVLPRQKEDIAKGWYGPKADELQQLCEKRGIELLWDSEWIRPMGGVPQKDVEHILEAM